MTSNDEAPSNAAGSAEHGDVAAYALGVFDEQETAAFEEHLETCRQCQAELESLLPVADLLAEVDAGALKDQYRLPPEARDRPRRPAAVTELAQRWRRRWRLRRSAHPVAEVSKQPAAEPRPGIADVAAALAEIDGTAVRAFTTLDDMFRRLGPPAAQPTRSTR